MFVTKTMLGCDVIPHPTDLRPTQVQLGHFHRPYRAEGAFTPVGHRIYVGFWCVRGTTYHVPRVSGATMAPDPTHVPAAPRAKIWHEQSPCNN